MRNYIILPFIIFLAVLFSGCEKELNFFTVNQDIEFGEQMDSMVLADFPVLNENLYPDAYDHIYRIRDEILKSDDIKYKDRFDWTVRIIDDTVLNAFATPGGFMYFYTGIIKFLDDESQLAGVVAHEMAHADRRHSTKQMTKIYGYSILADILLGKNSSKMAELLTDLALGLGGLKFSREHEYEADEYSVKYLADGDYHPKGISGFFEKMEESRSQGRPPEFMSTHPSPDNRLEAIDEVWKSLGSPSGELFVERYAEFKQDLP